MKLSEAIRTGAKLAPQAFEMTEGPNGETCALAAAAQATWGSVPTGMFGELERRYPILLDICVLHPEASHHDSEELEAVIMSLNDDYRWTREQIADWVEKVENDLR